MKASFIRVADADDKAARLRFEVQQQSISALIEPASFRHIPGSPFAYWASASLVSHFATLENVEGTFTTAVGVQTSDDFRFIRTSWERCCELDDSWPPLAKGGSYSPFYSDMHLVVNWTHDGSEVRAFDRSFVRNRGLYFREGLTWPIKNRFSLKPWPLPSGAIFAHVGPSVFVSKGDSWNLLSLQALMSSSSFVSLTRLMAGWNFELGTVGRTPIPACGADSTRALATLARAGWSVRRGLDTCVEVSHAFVLPGVLQVGGGLFGVRVGGWAERVAAAGVELGRVQAEIDELCFELYGISDEDRRAITEGFGVSDGGVDADGDDDPDGDADDADEGVVLDPVGLAAGLVSWAVGVAVGRFDVRLVTGEREWPVEPDPFDPLPVCSPGMLTGEDGLPLQTAPAGYPLVVSPVLVDDPGHELDIAARVRAVFDVVFGADADRWWSDVGAVLDPRGGDIGAWLRRGFFDHHLKTYSKSRRKAPILWPWGTRSGSYLVWVYAHQATGDTTFRVMNDLVVPKIAVEERRLTELRQEAGPAPSASQRRTIDAKDALLAELREFRDDLNGVAPLWAPDLNDGIVLVLAPAAKLFSHHKPWAKELAAQWKKLAAGAYDWSQIAMHLWPERVVPKCVTDRSLAIAHGLENNFWQQDPANADKWSPRATPLTPVDTLIGARANPATTHTLQRATP